jgi:hypothetical protein
MPGLWHRTNWLAGRPAGRSGAGPSPPSGSQGFVEDYTDPPWIFTSGEYLILALLLREVDLSPEKSHPTTGPLAPRRLIADDRLLGTHLYARHSTTILVRCMTKHRADCCAYCGAPLRIVAGFCAACHVPASVAQRAKLVAGTQRATTDIKRIVSDTPLMVAPSPGTRPRWVRPLWGVGALSLLAAIFFILVHINGLPFVSPVLPSSSLAASLAPDGPTVASLTAGQTWYLTYHVAVGRAGSVVQLRLTPAHAPTYTLTEHWSRGDGQRVLPLQSLAPGAWRITLLDNGQVVQSLVIQVAAATS